MISAIVAVDLDWGIGYQGQLLEHLPPDMKYFRALTTGNVVVMGRKTWDSLPKRPLENRFNIIVTRNPKHFHNFTDKKSSYMSLDLQETINAIKDPLRLDDIFIIGGGEIYKQLLPYCDRVYVTKIGKSHKDVDTYFPNLDKDSHWEVITCTELKEYNNIPYTFLTYERRQLTL